MSITDATEPACPPSPGEPAVAAVLDARRRDLGGFEVRRLLPSRARPMVGPFVYFDHMGPSTFAPGEGLDVPPHPHIGLATVTYLFDGEILHRDSLGFRQPIRPGDLNWMTAGRGIVHSERTAAEVRARGSTLHGLQLWVALPRADEECAPAFVHHPGATLPELDRGGARLRVLLGEAWGARSPVRTLSPVLYADAAMPEGGAVEVPDGNAERAAYVVEGAIACGGCRAGPGRMLVFAEGARATLRADGPARVVFVGGAPLDGARHILWNFVGSSRERLDRARRDWIEGRFPVVPGDEVERLPFRG
jgi:redox-sensitive bicupin YhaK (pirin superfamily)